MAYQTSYPLTIRNNPSPIVGFAMVMPIGLYSSAMLVPQTEYLKFL